jgi:hypothetical protein
MVESEKHVNFTDINVAVVEAKKFLKSWKDLDPKNAKL